MNEKEFNSKEDLFKFLKQNKSALIASKTAGIKTADSVSAICETEHGNRKTVAMKADGADSSDNVNGDIIVKAVINTTNLIDSHMDMHVKGIWDDDLINRNQTLLLEEHKCSFRFIISDEVAPSVKTMSWSSLGYNYAGSTQALIFEAIVKADRNEYMYEQYVKGHVKNHSVGMRYVEILLAVNSEDKYYSDEKAVWDKYYPVAANKDVADSREYFWVVKKAKIVEGSAVPIGSNYITPTLSVKPKSSEPEPIDEISIEQIKQEITNQFNNLKN